MWRVKRIRSRPEKRRVTNGSVSIAATIIHQRRLEQTQSSQKRYSRNVSVLDAGSRAWRVRQRMRQLGSGKGCQWNCAVVSCANRRRNRHTLQDVPMKCRGAHHAICRENTNTQNVDYAIKKRSLQNSRSMREGRIPKKRVVWRYASNANQRRHYIEAPFAITRKRLLTLFPWPGADPYCVAERATLALYAGKYRPT